jgi:hypothetical protein
VGRLGPVEQGRQQRLVDRLFRVVDVQVAGVDDETPGAAGVGREKLGESAVDNPLTDDGGNL